MAELEWDFHEDVLASLNEDSPLAEKLGAVLTYVRRDAPSVSRLAVALYDRQTDTLKTYAHSSTRGNELPFYEAKLSESTWLLEVARRRRPRIVNDTSAYGEATVHSRRISGGYGSSYTLPIFRAGELLGFLFFNAEERGAFDQRSLHHFDLLGHLLALLVLESLAAPRALVATVRTATVLAQHRDFETGSHMDRMAHYARIIALDLAPRHGLTDADVEHIFLFAPLHDIGKIAIPDEIMLKRGKLSPDEFETMKTHTTKGHELIDEMLTHFRLDGSEHVKLLRNIALCHHEAMRGQGYPNGRSGEDIPLEARIVAVADVFDALTSARPYKQPWSSDAAFAFLLENADTRFDRECVTALYSHRAEVEAIQERFREDSVG